MAGNKEGGKKAAAKNKAKYGKDFYARIGKIGGENGFTGGFYVNRELARVVGAIGGSRSKRGFRYDKVKKQYMKVKQETR